jgi:hypothetical protein
VVDEKKIFFQKIIFLFIILALLFLGGFPQNHNYNAYSMLHVYENNTLLIKKETSYKGCTQIIVQAGDKAISLKQGNMLLHNVSQIVFRCENLSLNISINGSYMLNITSNLIVLAPENHEVFIKEVPCRNALGYNGYYITLNIGMLANKNASLKASVYQNNSFYNIPQTLLKYSLKNHTFSIPPGKCSSPPNQILYNNATVLFSYQYNDKKVVVSYFLSTNTISETIPSIQSASSTSSIFETSLSPYSSSVLPHNRSVLSGSQKIYLLLLFIGIIIFFASSRRRGKSTSPS